MEDFQPGGIFGGGYLGLLVVSVRPVANMKPGNGDLPSIDGLLSETKAFDELFFGTKTTFSPAPALANLLGFFTFFSLPMVLLNVIFGPSS